MTGSNGHNYIIPIEKKKEMLQCFMAGHGYKRTATITGLGQYQVRYYSRKFRSGDTSWADKPSRSDAL